MSDDAVAVAPADIGAEENTDQGESILTRNSDGAADTAAAEENTDTGVGGDQAAEKPADGDADKGDSAAGDGSQDTPLDASAFTAPEGVTLDTALIEQAMPLFEEAGINQAQSQKFIDLYAGKMQEVEQGKLDTFNQLRQDWVKQAKSDPEYGGDKFNENLASAKAALDTFGTPELSKLLDDFGVGDHPEMIRFMVAVGRLTQEDTPGAGAKLGVKSKSAADILYPTSEP